VTLNVSGLLNVFVFQHIGLLINFDGDCENINMNYSHDMRLGNYRIQISKSSIYLPVDLD